MDSSSFTFSDECLSYNKMKKKKNKKILVERNGLDAPQPQRGLTSSSYSEWEPSPPRPRFLRYNPERSQEILTRIQKAIEATTTTISAAEEQENHNSGNSVEKFEEDEEEEEENDGCSFKGLFKLLCFLFVLKFFGSYMSDTDSSSLALLPYGPEEEGYYWRNKSIALKGDEWRRPFGERNGILLLGKITSEEEQQQVSEEEGAGWSSEVVGEEEEEIIMLLGGEETLLGGRRRRSSNESRPLEDDFDPPTSSSSVEEEIVNLKDPKDEIISDDEDEKIHDQFMKEADAGGLKFSIPSNNNNMMLLKAAAAVGGGFSILLLLLSLVLAALCYLRIIITGKKTTAVRSYPGPPVAAVEEEEDKQPLQKKTQSSSSRAAAEEPAPAWPSYYHVRAPTVELLGEIEFQQPKVGSSKENNNCYSTPLVHSQSASFEFSVTSRKTSSANDDHENADRDQSTTTNKAAVLITPIRRSSRLQNRGGIQSSYAAVGRQ